MSGRPKLIRSKSRTVSALSFAVFVTPHSSCRDLEDARKFSAPERKVLKADVKKGLDSLISASMARNIRDTKRPSLVKISQVFPFYRSVSQADCQPPSAETQKNLRFNLPDSCRQKEESVIAVSIQPSGIYPRRSGSLSSSPRSTPDPAENITRRVDPRYNSQPARHSLSQAFHEKNGRRLDNGGYTMSEVRIRVETSHWSRSIEILCSDWFGLL